MSTVQSGASETHTRPYTLGVSIAVVLIFLIAIFHAWKFVFKKVKKWINGAHQVEAAVIEIPIPHQFDRKVSSACIQELEMVLKYDDETAGISLHHVQKRPVIMRSYSEDSGVTKLKRKKSLRRMRHSIGNNKMRQVCGVPENKLTFFAGYSHRHCLEK